MPLYTEILPDGTRRDVHYRMKDCPIMRQIRHTQMAARLARQERQGIILPDQRRKLWGQAKHRIDARFAQSQGREIIAPGQARVPQLP